MSTESSAKRKVKTKWPDAYCLKDGKMYYIFGNPKRDPYGKRYRKDSHKFAGDDMLSYGESSKEAWEGVEL